ncbi:MAG: N-acetyl-alpha-D-glucosaminyl L-malate synthase BshA [Candidatus Aenigmarchaeota archaeon]|nr:N-acetyl-alpha-D-glucosaminyl L-malate synthase BshA [Candidatus Aenigmarchaeota archaeon]
MEEMRKLGEGLGTLIHELSHKPIKAGIVCEMGVGGSSIVGSSLAEGLRRNGNDVHIISYSRSFRRLPKEIKFHHIPSKDFNVFHHLPLTLVTAGKIEDVIRKENLDVINVHYALPYAASAYLAKQMVASHGIKIPVVTTLHGTDVHTVGVHDQFRSVTKFVLESSDGITTICKFLADKAKENFDIDSEIKVIHNFVDTQKFRRRENPGFRKSIAEESEKIMVHASNFRPIKRIDHIIRAFKTASKSIPSKLILLGDGPEMPKMKRLASKLNIGDKITFTGAVKDVQKYFSVSDLFVMASENEGMPLSIMEAMSCRVPAVAVNRGGMPEIVEDGKTGYVAEYGDTRDIAEKCMKILSDGSLCEKMARNSRERIEKDFNMRKNVAEYERYYRRLMLTSI